MNRGVLLFVNGSLSQPIARRFTARVQREAFVVPERGRRLSRAGSEPFPASECVTPGFGAPSVVELAIPAASAVDLEGEKKSNIKDCF